jgi:hypothetical protein
MTLVGQVVSHPLATQPIQQVCGTGHHCSCQTKLVETLLDSIRFYTDHMCTDYLSIEINGFSSLSQNDTRFT